jgi:hypothetical protein
LTPQEEAKFTAEYKKLSEERTSLADKIDDTLKSLAATAKTDKKTRAKLLSEYEMATKKMAQIQQSEIPAMKKIFNEDRFVEYVLLKREVLKKFREVLATAPAAPPAKVASAPQVPPPATDLSKTSPATSAATSNETK